MGLSKELLSQLKFEESEVGGDLGGERCDEALGVLHLRGGEKVLFFGDDILAA